MALKHAYLEKLLHKAFDPMFGRVFLEAFLARYDFNTPSYPSHNELEKWNRRALKYYSSWLPKLGQLNFVGVFRIIYGLVSAWKDVVREDHEMRFDDVVRECVSMCGEMTDFLVPKVKMKNEGWASLCHDFVHLVFSVHHKSNQTGYFALLNDLNEQMERAIVPIEHASVYYEEYSYEGMELLATLIKTLEKNLLYFDEIPRKKGKSMTLAKGVLHMVSFARFNDLCRIKGSTKDVETSISTFNSQLFKFVSSLLHICLPRRLQYIVLPLLVRKLQSGPFKLMQKTGRTVDVELFYPLPLSVKREMERLEGSLSARMISVILTICQEYRTHARKLHQINRSQILSYQEKVQRRAQGRDTFLATCSKWFPNHLFNLFTWHTLILENCMKYNSSVVHFSNLPVTLDSKSVPGRMEREYLQKIAWWINEVNKWVPIKERKEHLKLMVQFVCEEVYYSVPSEQGDLVNLTIVLMIDNGFVVNFTV